MPVDPGAGERHARDVADLIREAEAALLRVVAERTRTGVAGDGDALATLRAMQAIEREARRRLAPVEAGLRERIMAAVVDAYNAGAALAVADLDAAAVVYTPGGLGALTAAERIAQAAVTTAVDAIRVAPTLLSAAYRDAVAAAAMDVLDGARTRVQAAQTVLDRLLADGVRGYTDRTGRVWTLDTYVEMAVRTVTGQAAMDGHITQLDAAGVRLVQVSDSPRECGLCRPWERAVLALSGPSGPVLLEDVYGQPVTVHVAGTVGQARAAGLFHPNCRHTLGIYLPGATTPRRPSPDPAGYEAGQRQRQIERHIRAWKGREATALTPDRAAQARAKVRYWQAMQREHVAAHGLKRLPARERYGVAH